MIHTHTCAGCAASVTCVCSEKRVEVYCAHCMNVAYILTGHFLLHRVPTREELERAAKEPIYYAAKPY